MKLCEQCEELACTVCGHEACPVCQVECDHPECIEWTELPSGLSEGKSSHVCSFPPCPKGCVRKYGDDDFGGEETTA